MRLHELVTRAAQRTPEAPALLDGEVELDYRTLNRSSERLRLELEELGLAPGDRVALCMPKSWRALVAMQAVLRAGASYLPIDPESPPDRQQAIVEGAQPRFVISQDAREVPFAPDATPLTLEGLQVCRVSTSSKPRPAPRGRTAAQDEALVLHSSGSTGTPKGIRLSHENVLAFVEWACRRLAISSSDRFANHAAFHFDLSLLDLYAAFARGASVMLINSEVARSPPKLASWLRQHCPTIWYSVPSAIAMMMQRGDLPHDVFSPPRKVILAGETFAAATFRSLFQMWPTSEFFNFYGPTETNVCTAQQVQAQQLRQGRPAPIGSPCSGNEVWLETQSGARIESIGPQQLGELVVRGPSVMLGYVGEADIGDTYRTGDLAWRDDQGLLHFVGRLDGQIKLRGHRVELGEIEARLIAHSAISDATVVVLGEGFEARLHALLVTSRPISLLQIKAHCAGGLLRHMIVDAIDYVDTLPRTKNGKRDRPATKALAQELHR